MMMMMMRVIGSSSSKQHTTKKSVECIGRSKVFPVPTYNRTNNNHVKKAIVANTINTAQIKGTNQEPLLLLLLGSRGAKGA